MTGTPTTLLRTTSPWIVLVISLLIAFGSVLAAPSAGAQAASPPDVIPGECPEGQKVEYSGSLSWTADDDYATVYLVGGPPDPEQNDDPDGRFKEFSGVVSGQTIEREEHDISFVCVVDADDVEQPFVRITFLCKVPEGGGPVDLYVGGSVGFVTSSAFEGGDYVFRIRNEDPVANSWTAGVGGSGLWSGSFDAATFESGEYELVSTSTAVAGVSVATVPGPNLYSGTASTNETLCDVADPIDTNLVLTSMCQLGDDHIWRVQNDNDYPVDFRVVLGAGADGTAQPGWTYFLGDQTTTKIEWGGGDSGFVLESATKAANQETCRYEITLVKQWDGGEAPNEGLFVTLTANSESINEGETIDLEPGTTYLVTENVPEGWEPTEGIGEFTVPDWPGPEAFFGTYDPRFGDAGKFFDHVVVNEPVDTENEGPIGDVQVLDSSITAPAEPPCFDGQAENEDGICVAPEPPDDDVLVLGVQIESTTTTTTAVTAETLPFTGMDDGRLTGVGMLAIAVGMALLALSGLGLRLLRVGRHERASALGQVLGDWNSHS